MDVPPPKLLADAMLGALARNHLLIRSDRVEEQVRQVLDTFGIVPEPSRLFRRCLRCNVPLAIIDAEEARAPPFVARTQEEFRTVRVAAGSTGAAPTSAGWRIGWNRPSAFEE